MDHSSFANLSRDELINRARAAGVDRPELMTRVELADELVRRAEADPLEQRRARGWLGVARDLVASVVESGLNLPDAAALIRGERGELELKGPEPVATVTLAEIYATQGHVQRALSMLDEVIASEPEHEAARRLRDRLLQERPTRGARTQALALRYETEPPPAEPERVAEAEAVTLAEREPVAAVEDRPAPRAPAEAEAFIQVDAFPELRPTPEPVAAEPEPVAAEPEPVAAEPEPVAAEPEPVAAEPEPVAAEPEEHEPIRGAEAVEEPVTERPEPITERPTVEEPEPSTQVAPTVVLLRGYGTDPVVCWDLGTPSDESTELALVCVAFESTAQGIERNDLTMPVLERRGRAVLESVPPSATVRVALGADEPNGFVALAIASELELREGVLSVLYRPPASESLGPTDEERALVHAFAPGRSIGAGATPP